MGTSSVGVISLIPKGGDPRNIENWRPINLLTVDTKILLKSLANRLKLIIASVIPSYQNVTSGRTIYNTLSTIRDTIAIHNKKKKPLYITSLDQKKAYDRVNHKFLFHLLSVIGLPVSFIAMIRTVYSNFSCCVKNVTSLSPVFPYARGVRQGDPLATSLYVLALQPALNAAMLILGQGELYVSNNIVTAYADDVTFLLPRLEMVSAIIQAFNAVAVYSEAALNISKSAIKPCFVNNSDITLTHTSYNDIPIIKDSITILGITFSDKESIDSTQWENLILTTKTSITRATCYLKKEQYSQRAKWVTTKLWPRWAYLFKVLQPTKSQVSQLSLVLSEEVWLGAKHWLSLDILMSPITKGGINLISVKNRIDAYRVKHLTQCLIEGPNSNKYQLVQTILNNYNCSNVGFGMLHTVPDPHVLRNLTPYYEAAYMAWNRLNTVFLPENKEEFMQLPCFNSKALYDIDPSLGLSSAYAYSIKTYTIHQFLNYDPAIKTRAFDQLRTAIRQATEEWTPSVLPQCQCMEETSSQSATMASQKWKVPCYLMRGEELIHLCAWNNKNIVKEFSISDEEQSQVQVEQYWKIIQSSISPSLLKNRYWRFMHGSVATSAFFATTAIYGSSTCLLCKQNDLSYQHQFRSCVKLKMCVETLSHDIQTLGLILDDLPFVLFEEVGVECRIANFLIMAFVFTVLESIKSSAHNILTPISQIKINEIYLSVPAKHLTIMAKSYPPQKDENKQHWTIFTHANLLAKWTNKDTDVHVRTKEGYLSINDICNQDVL